jgi:glutathione S-transferase
MRLSILGYSHLHENELLCEPNKTGSLRNFQRTLALNASILCYPYRPTNTEPPTMSVEKPIIFYDIASREPRTTFAANPWKIRLALNLKGIPYQTQWVEMPDITAVREKFGVPANRTNPDGTPYHTLPVIHDTSTGELVGDSFEIALYLDSTYPGGPRLFRPFTTGLTAAFNARVDGVFSKFAGLCTQMPFDPAVLDAVQAMFVKRLPAIQAMAGQQSFSPQGDVSLESFQAALGELAKAYRHTGGTTDYFWRACGTAESQAQRPLPGRETAGPFLDGDEPVYADLVLAAWLKMFEISMPPEHWQLVRGWHGGLWGRIVDALGEWSEIK